MTYERFALGFYDKGWHGVLPLPPGKKSPPPDGFTGADGAWPTRNDVGGWTVEEPDGNIAIRVMQGMVAIDVDAYNGKQGLDTMGKAIAELGPLPRTYKITSRTDGSAKLLFRIPVGVEFVSVLTRLFGPGVEIIQFHHRYLLAPGSTNPDDDGRIVQIYDPSDTELPVGFMPAPTEVPALPANWVERLTKQAPAEEAPAIESPVWDDVRGTSYVTSGIDGELKRLDRMRELATPNGRGYTGEPWDQTCFDVACRLIELANAGGYDLDRMRRTFMQRAPQDAHFDAARLASKWEGAAARVGRKAASVPLSTGNGISDLFNGPQVRHDERVQLRVVEDGETPPAEGVDVLFESNVKMQLEKIRIAEEARRRYRIEEHEKTWREPETFGTLTDELLFPDEESPWRVKGILGANHNAVLIAGRKAGKTSMVNNLIRSLVDHDPFLGKFEVEPVDGGVAVFNYELDSTQYRRWLRRQGIRNTDIVHPLHLRGRSLPLASERIREWVVRWLAERQVKVWIIDPYSRAYLGSIESGNDEAQVSTFLDYLDLIKHEAGVTEIVMPVHTPKAKVEAGEETAIGSQRLEAWPDALWYLTRDRETNLRFLRAEGRDVDVDEEQLTFDAETQQLTFGGWNRTAVKTRGDLDRVLAHLKENPGITYTALQDDLDLSSRRVAEAVRRAGRKIVRVPGPKRAQFHYLAGSEPRADHSEVAEGA